VDVIALRLRTWKKKRRMIAFDAYWKMSEKLD